MFVIVRFRQMKILKKTIRSGVSNSHGTHKTEAATERSSTETEV